MKTFMIGAGAHARICRRILLNEPFVVESDFRVVYDANPAIFAPWPGCQLHHDWNAALNAAADHRCTHFVVAIGSSGERRQYFGDKLVEAGLIPVPVIHHTASIGEETTIGKGLQILANARIGDEAKIGDWCMIHSLGMVEHESVVEDGVTLMAASAVAGKATLRRHCVIGVNATVLGVEIGEGAIVGSGAVVPRDVRPFTTVVGPKASVLRVREAAV